MAAFHINMSAVRFSPLPVTTRAERFTNKSLPRTASLRGGFTLLETLVSVGIATVLGLALCSLWITCSRTWKQEMRQNEMNMRGRQLVDAMALDARVADSIVFLGSTVNSTTDQATYTSLGTCAYTPTPPTGQSLVFSSKLPSYSAAGFPAADRLVVFRIPSYDASGLLPGSWDYIGYGWVLPVGQTPGVIYKTCIPNSLSARTASYGALAGAGTFDTLLQYSFHIATTAPTSPAPLTTSYPGTSYDPFSTTTSVTPAGSALKDVDAITLTATISAASWGATPVPASTLTSTYKLRAWRQT